MGDTEHIPDFTPAAMRDDTLTSKFPRINFPFHHTSGGMCMAKCGVGMGLSHKEAKFFRGPPQFDNIRAGKGIFLETEDRVVTVEAGSDGWSCRQYRTDFLFCRPFCRRSFFLPRQKHRAAHPVVAVLPIHIKTIPCPSQRNLEKAGNLEGLISTVNRAQTETRFPAFSISGISSGMECCQRPFEKSAQNSARAPRWPFQWPKLWSTCGLQVLP